MDKQNIDSEEAHKIVRQYQILAGIVVIVLAVGVTFYHFVEGWRWLDSLYFSVISLATVGYGDFTPKTDLGKIFTMLYLVIGISIFAALLNNMVKSRVAKRSIKKNNSSE